MNAQQVSGSGHLAILSSSLPRLIATSSLCPVLCNQNQGHTWLTTFTVIISLSHPLGTKVTFKTDPGKYRVGL